MELLKAQAVAARSYAIAAVGDMPTAGKRWTAGEADISVGQYDQDWKAGPYHEFVERAVVETEGMVVTHTGDNCKNCTHWGGVIEAFFHSYGNQQYDLKQYPFDKTLTPTQADWLSDWPTLAK